VAEEPRQAEPDARARYRSLREDVERDILPLATSLDGRRFTFQASLYDLRLEVGGYAALELEGRTLLGQVTELEIERADGPDLSVGDERARVVIRLARGTGVVLGGDGTSFHDATVRPAEPEDVAALLADRPPRTPLTVGELAAAPGVPCELDAAGFDRHTFVCGQSGSGKTYSLGVVLERLVAETSLRIVILDPNSDYVRLAEVRPDAGDDGERYAGAAGGVVVRRAASEGTERLRLRFADLAPATQAALLGLDPIADREEYAELLDLVEGAKLSVGSLLDRAGDEYPALRLRARNLGLDRWTIWAKDDPGSLLDDLGPDGPRCLVVDLGSLAEREEQGLVVEAVLAELWARRRDRNPVLVVVDEAHTACPQVPEDPLTARATEHAIRIAGEGRKYGLYLLLATQRPQKLHENVLSQCDNLMLMRMNSEADLIAVGAAFSAVPAGFLARSTTFKQGEGLVAGKLTPHPFLVRFGRRISEEGGGDVATDWLQAS
jgi:DNA helicase HerA-like ATPase